jgi:hypothetical protein
MTPSEREKKAKREKCHCLHFEADMDENEDGVVCHCGHVIEEHRPSRKYPGDTSCKADER